MSGNMESDYKIIRELGKGAFGTVYLIKHKSEGDVFALKAVDLVVASHEEKKSAEKEAQLMSQLDHDHVVRYVASYFKGSTLFIYTEYCEGGDMAHFLEDTSDKLPEQLIVCWVYQTVSALEYLHARKILHRDLKPQNIYLSGEADVKLGDLGIARVLDNGADMASTMAGTPFYMSPEIFQMKGYNHKTDIWSFGCVVYELAAGERAFDTPVIQFLIFKVVAGLVPPIQSSYSPQLRDLVKAMMAKEPDARPSATQLLTRSPIKEFKARPQKALTIMKANKLNTKWGTETSTVDFRKLMMGMSFDPPSTFKESDICIPVDSLRLHRQRFGLAAPSVRPDVSRSELSQGRAAIMQAVMRGQMRTDQSTESTLSSTASSSSDDSDLDTTLGASQGTTTKKAVEAQFLMKQIQVLQRHCAAGLGQETLVKAYSILDSVTNPVQLKASLVRLMGDDKFKMFGDKIMYLRLFEVGLDKVNSQLVK